MKFWHLGIVSMLALFVTACAKQEPAQVTAHEETPDKALSEMDTPAATPDPYATDPYARESAPRPQDNRASDIGGRDTKLIAGKDARGGGRTHTVQKGDTLYSLARKYYNDQSKWKQIWEANRDRIPNRDKLSVGTQLVIP